MHDSALKIDLSQVNGSAFLTVEGEIDAESVVQLRAVLDAVQLDKHVVVDMAGVRFMDSTGINALVDRSLRIEGTGGSLRITNPSRSVQRVVEITGLAQVFYEPRDE
jgi:anti-sigma B factor antagonist